MRHKDISGKSHGILHLKSSISGARIFIGYAELYSKSSDLSVCLFIVMENRN